MIIRRLATAEYEHRDLPICDGFLALIEHRIPTRNDSEFGLRFGWPLRQKREHHVNSVSAWHGLGKRPVRAEDGVRGDLVQTELVDQARSHRNRQITMHNRSAVVTRLGVIQVYVDWIVVAGRG